jgi:maltose alpha-D-glucosyltransferase/alpha-amylase
MLHPENRKVLAFVRRFENEVILVVANTSRFVQFADLELSAFQGLSPVEMFGSTEFPPIADRPYFLTLGPHAWYWFTLEPQRVQPQTPAAALDFKDVPDVLVTSGWSALFEEEGSAELTALLPSFLGVQRWFGAKARRIKSVTLREAIPLPYSQGTAQVSLLEVQYADGGEADTYLLPLSAAFGERADEVWKRSPQAVVARLSGPEGSGLLYDCLNEQAFCDALLNAIARRRRFRQDGRVLAGTPTRILRQHWREDTPVHAAPSTAEQSNNSVVFGEQLILKLYRRLEPGVNPDLEIGRFLTEHTRFHNIAHVAGALEYRRPVGEPITLAVLQEYVPNQGDAWQHTRTHLQDYLHAALERRLDPPPPAGADLMGLTDWEPPASVRELAGAYLDQARVLGRRTAEMHVALASDHEDPEFAPEAPSAHAQRSVYQGVRTLSAEVFQLLKRSIPALPPAARAQAATVLELEGSVLSTFRPLLHGTVQAHRIRVHGDYHLGQVLYTGHDFVIIDFEGEPARSLRDRRLKRFALKDVAGMLRSFDYAAHAALFELPDAAEQLAPWSAAWVEAVSGAFLDQYLRSASGSAFLPADRGQAALLLNAMMVEKALYELRYELNNRPAWVGIPLRGLASLLGGVGVA